jgi:hypothetical protein
MLLARSRFGCRSGWEIVLAAERTFTPGTSSSNPGWVKPKQEKKKISDKESLRSPLRTRTLSL